MPTAPSPVGATFHTSLGVRLHQVRRTGGPFNWLLFPGGPGIGSDSLRDLAACANLPGGTWLVDLPGDGTNTAAPGAPANPYRLWPQVLLEAVDALPAPIAVGHSTGGEYLLSVPELEHRLRGLVLISSAPDSGWMPGFVALHTANLLPEGGIATDAYEANPTDDNLRAVSLAFAAWAFSEAGLGAGRAMLERVPYNAGVVEWHVSDFARRYVSAWWPGSLPTLIISGSDDRIIDQSLWEDPHYTGKHVQRWTIEGAGHFPWIEQPAAVCAVLSFFRPLHDAEFVPLSCTMQPGPEPDRNSDTVVSPADLGGGRAESSKQLR